MATTRIWQRIVSPRQSNRHQPRAHITSESYRRCRTSVGWAAQALALRLMHAGKSWNHDAFLNYADRWMFQDDAADVKTIKETTGRDLDHDYSRQGQAWDGFVNEMWANHRKTLAAPIDGWKQPHDDHYLPDRNREDALTEPESTCAHSIAALQSSLQGAEHGRNHWQIRRRRPNPQRREPTGIAAVCRLE